jgi:plastocyanin
MNLAPPPAKRSVPVHSRRLAGLCVLVAAGVLVAACGGGNSNSGSQAAATPTSTPAAAAKSPSGTSASGTVSLAPKDDQLMFDTSNLTAKAGKVTVKFTNNAALSHNVVLINAANKVLGKTPTFDGGTKSFSVTLKPGTYTYYCSVPGHRQAGMQGTLTVK